jgi:hypothetical protein
MSDILLNEKELQEAIRYEIISPSFAERVRELIKAYEQVASQQSVQRTACQHANTYFRVDGNCLHCIDCGEDV